jgi:hypothetical protein
MADEYEAFRLRIIGDATIIDPDHLGGPWVFQLAGDLNTDELDAWIILSVAAASPDSETRRREQVWQVDILSRDPDRGQRIADRLDAFVPWDQSAEGGTGILPDLTTRRLAEPIYAEPGPGDMTDITASTLHHKVCQFRVATYPL